MRGVPLKRLLLLSCIDLICINGSALHFSMLRTDKCCLSVEMKMTRNHAGAVLATFAVLLSLPVGAQKNYTDGGDLYGGSRAPDAKETPAKQAAKPATHRSGKFDPYTEGAHTKSHLAPVPAKTLPDAHPQPDDVAKSGKFDPYTDGASK